MNVIRKHYKDRWRQIYKICLEQKQGIKENDIDRVVMYMSIFFKIAQSGVNGWFRTPRHIMRMMVEMMEPKVIDFSQYIENNRGTTE